MSDTEEEDNLGKCIKITLVGEPSTGKSSVCSRFVNGSVCVGGSGPTQGAQVTAAQWAGVTSLRAGVTSLRAGVTSLRLCDVAGSALHTHMLPNYLYDSDIVIFVYDLSNLQSFEMLNTWVEKVKDVMSSEAKKPLLALFGNKSDLEHQRAVRLSDVQKFASEYFLENFKGSARTGDMITILFSSLISKVLGIELPPEEAPYKKTIESQVSENKSGIEEVADELIVNRKVLRKLQRKSTSAVLIEKYTENVRFCIICNYLGKIIPALQSRCTRFRFAPLHRDQIVPRLKDIAQKENVTLTEGGVRALLALAGGDMRKALNALQSTWLAARRVSEDAVYCCAGQPLRSDVARVLRCLLDESDFAAGFQQIQDLKIAKGLALGDILTEIHTLIHRIKFPPGVLMTLLIKMADSEARLSVGCSERVELAALVAAFQLCKEQIDLTQLAA